MKTVGKILQIPVYVLSVTGSAVINAAIMLPLVYATSIVLEMTGHYVPIPDGAIVPEKDIAILAITMFSVGIFEETYFRYLVMDCFLMKYLKLPAILAVLLSSFAFGVAHLGNAYVLGLPWLASLPQAVGAFGAGLWFAYVYRRYGLHFAIFTHALYNFLVSLPILFG